VRLKINKMADEINWIGGSGKEYPFNIYSKEQNFKELDGNYIFAKQTINGWDAVYIGEGDLKTRTKDKVHLKCAEDNGFTHYHVHKNTNESNRKAEEADLIAGNPECLYENAGCNKTHDG
jgi:hypothetical protein